MIEKLLTRLPAELKEQITKKAKELGVSTNALVLQILWDWAKNPRG